MRWTSFRQCPTLHQLVSPVNVEPQPTTYNLCTTNLKANNPLRCLEHLHCMMCGTLKLERAESRALALEATWKLHHPSRQSHDVPGSPDTAKFSCRHLQLSSSASSRWSPAWHLSHAKPIANSVGIPGSRPLAAETLRYFGGQGPAVYAVKWRSMSQPKGATSDWAIPRSNPSRGRSVLAPIKKIVALWLYCY